MADMVLAAERCRMLGLADAASLQGAIMTARADRAGTTGGMSASRALRHTRHRTAGAPCQRSGRTNGERTCSRGKGSLWTMTWLHPDNEGRGKRRKRG